MDLKLIKQRLIATAGKYRYMILLVIAGILLLLLPTSGRSEKIQSEPCAVSTVDAPDMRKELELILSQIDGAGEVRVLLSMASGEETIYQTDTDESVNGESLHTQTDTVIITNDSRTQSALIRQYNPPTYLGAVVVCKGADSPVVRLAIVSAVSKLTGLGADSISVLKMK